MNRHDIETVRRLRKHAAKTNYYLVSQNELKRIQKQREETGRKPRLLLHVCCAVCACAPLEWLSEAFDLTLFFNNSNIAPKAEYDRRLEELKRYLAESGILAELIVLPYDHEEYMKPLRPMASDPEGFGRCFFCYAVRMREAYAYAAAHGFDYFTTIMSVSRQKDSQKMNQIGRSLSRLFPKTAYFYSDFKKGGGQIRQKELTEQYGLYRQDYCGCEYSFRSSTSSAPMPLQEEAQTSGRNDPLSAQML